MCVGRWCGRWASLLDRTLNDVIGGQCVFKILVTLTSLPCFHSFFQLIYFKYYFFIVEKILHFIVSFLRADLGTLLLESRRQV